MSSRFPSQITRGSAERVSLLPLLVPIVSGSVRATTALIDTGSVPFEPLQLLFVTDVAYLIVSFLTFDYVLDE